MEENLSKFKSALNGRVAVYIDAANLERSVQKMYVHERDTPEQLKHLSVDKLRWTVNYKKFREFFMGCSDLKEIRMYTAAFGTESHVSFLYFLKKQLKFKLITKPLKEYEDHTEDIPHRKANFDVELAVDSTFKIEEFDTLILFSGDCDFEYLVKFLRGKGKVVIGFSRTGNISKELPPALTHYFDILDFRSDILEVKPKPGAKNPTQ